MSVEVQCLLNSEYIYVGKPLPMLNEMENADFLLLIKESVIFSLEKRKLLTMAQRKKCIDILESRNITAQRNLRRV